MFFQKKPLTFYVLLLLLSIFFFSRNSYAGVVGDINRDGVIGLEEAINALQVIADVRPQPPPPDLTSVFLYYDFDEDSGLTVYDLTNNNLHGTIEAVVRTNGKIGRALLFGIDNAHVLVPPGLYGFNGYISIEAWIKLNEVDLDKIYRIVGCYNYHQLSFQIRDGKLEVLWENTSYLLGNQVLSPNVWTHIALTSNGASIRFYINGVEDNSSMIAFPVNILDNVNIGAHRVYGGDFYIEEFQGLIDEFKIWIIELSPQYILDYYNQTK